MDIEEQATMFSALADPTRLKLLKLLGIQPEKGALCVNALANVLEISQPAVSQHLRVLKSAGLIAGERRGNHVHYFINPTTIKRCQELIISSLRGESLTTSEICEDNPENKSPIQSV